MKLTKLPDADRDVMLDDEPADYGIREELDRAGIMSGIGEVEQHPQRLPTGDPRAVEFLRDGGWAIVDPARSGQDGGMVAHRGVVHPDEYIDDEALRVAIEDNMGFTFEQVRSVYASRAGGPIPNALRQLRDDIDVRMLALSRSGANMSLLERLLGLPRMTTARAVERAATRERSED